MAEQAASVSPAGIVRGPGTGTSDSILAMISTEESIVTAKATRQYRPLIEAMNLGRPLPKYATGLVSDRIPRFADGRMPDLGALAAASMDRQDARMGGIPDVNVPRDHGGMVTEVNVVGGDTTGATTTMGPRGPRTEITIDKAVAAALMNGADTRSVLKKLGATRLTGR